MAFWERRIDPEPEYALGRIQTSFSTEYRDILYGRHEPRFDPLPQGLGFKVSLGKTLLAPAENPIPLLQATLKREIIAVNEIRKKTIREYIESHGLLPHEEEIRSAIEQGSLHMCNDARTGEMAPLNDIRNNLYSDTAMRIRFGLGYIDQWLTYHSLFPQAQAA